VDWNSAAASFDDIVQAPPGAPSCRSHVTQLYNAVHSIKGNNRRFDFVGHNEEARPVPKTTVVSIT
jgi:hypothetical protein